MRVLILGGTTEASAITRHLAGDPRFEVTLSLAGRTEKPATLPGVALRVGGFGGATGLAHWLAETGIESVIDATHAFAAEISRNTEAATRERGIPLCTVVRPPWRPEPEDRWHTVATTEDAAGALGTEPRRVFLSVGRQGVGAFRSAPRHAYVIRSIEPPDAAALPPDITLIQARGPFVLQDEIDLLTSHRIDVVVTKNAGGAATYAKIEAARNLALPVIMIERPHKAGRDFVADADQAVDWLARLHATSRSERGV
ncbi:cobalt-precorrin-6A reductase [Hyphomicrobium sp.]|uniref:cobalt-precorrin-6A reductase n=1 Tax=Hyphomicrobium sp. TaxID=82 RepID=UPI0025BF28DA|nr:cobalt-precorrin-6A reductase [Hyphomicrobium sp.]MCC7252908.1 cobalt-precorrin-6A reductase [Hyphomicrobium sp.]